MLYQCRVKPATATVAASYCTNFTTFNAQKFTKTANIWGVSNNSLGTNTNRIVLFRKPV